MNEMNWIAELILVVWEQLIISSNTLDRCVKCILITQNTSQPRMYLWLRGLLPMMMKRLGKLTYYVSIRDCILEVHEAFLVKPEPNAIQWGNSR